MQRHNIPENIYIYIYIYCKEETKKKQQICTDSEFHVRTNFQTALHFFTIPLQEYNM